MPPRSLPLSLPSPPSQMSPSFIRIFGLPKRCQTPALERMLTIIRRLGINPLLSLVPGHHLVAWPLLLASQGISTLFRALPGAGCLR
jgi:hypothetical protein